MKNTIALVLAAALATVGYAHSHHHSQHTYDSVSRVNKNIIKAVEVSTPGASTPTALFNKVKNATDEPKYTDYLTALGARQQYLVGSEYRLRYVEEALFLNYSYDINDIWIQTTFDSKNILSAQAQLHGLYPPFTNINTLTEWQQKNAVPPLDNVLNDQWTQWQSDLGNKALIGGFNTFPINVQGHEDDYLLRVSPDNCPKLQTSLGNGWSAFYNATQTKNKDFLSRLATLSGNASIDILTGKEFCNYLKWADLNSVELTFTYITSDIDSCNSLINSFYNYVLDTDEALGYIGSNQFLKLVHDSLSSMLGDMKYHKTFFYKQNTQKESYGMDEQIRNNADENPNFFFYVTEEYNLRLMLSGLMGKDNRKNSTIFNSASTPSSNFILEASTKGDGTYTIEAYYNDQQFLLGGCSTLSCDASLFVAYLATVATITDVSTTCNTQTSETLIQ